MFDTSASLKKSQTIGMIFFSKILAFFIHLLLLYGNFVHGKSLKKGAPFLDTYLLDIFLM
jgi:hypothetical protein